MEILNEAEVRVAVITFEPARFKVRPIGKDLAPLADCRPSGPTDFSYVINDP